MCTPKVGQQKEVYIFMRKKVGKCRRYSAEFKIAVIMDMRENRLCYSEAVRKYWHTTCKLETDRYRKTVKLWERIYLKDGEAGLMEERRGQNRKSASANKPVPPEAGQDLETENKWLRERVLYLEAENAYLKKLDALIRAEEQKNGKKPK